ncbi:MAG: hypothetical protein G01um101429_518 [Parcubacteria group bacterium Gr01-1014_29]|nr:MAG: hypothetical protein G01um101429_518 [Parcubacteria group bacterium Gr01-1014_29]
MRVAITEEQAKKIIAYNSKKWGLLKAPKEVMVYRDQDGAYLNPAPNSFPEPAYE